MITSKLRDHIWKILPLEVRKQVAEEMFCQCMAGVQPFQGAVDEYESLKNSLLQTRENIAQRKDKIRHVCLEERFYRECLDLDDSDDSDDPDDDYWPGACYFDKFYEVALPAYHMSTVRLDESDQQCRRLLDELLLWGKDVNDLQNAWIGRYFVNGVLTIDAYSRLQACFTEHRGIAKGCKERFDALRESVESANATAELVIGLPY